MKTHLLLTRPRATALVMALALSWGPGGFFASGQAMAAPPAASREAMVTLNFVNAEIEGVARAMAAILSRQILVDPRVKGTITLYSDQPMSARAAYQNFLAALRGQGFSVVDVAGLLKIVPEAEAKLQTGVVDVGTVRRSGDQVLTQIFRLQNESANNLVAVLRPLISPNNTINANPSSNTLVITDYADNLQRIGQMIAALDVPTNSDLEAIPLQHAVAVDLAPVVQRLADGGGAAAAPGAASGGAATMVMADARTNTLMVRTSSPARLTLVRNLIQRLDRPGNAGVGGSGIHVVYLKNADAVKLAQVLRAAYPGAGGASGGSGVGSGGSPVGGALSTPVGASTTNAGGASGASSQATAPVSASAQPSVGGFIQADPSTNSLIITASEAQYRQLRAVIDQLDGRRAQIYIEAMIVKVDANKAAQLGVQWAGAAGDRTIVAGATNLPINGASTSIPGLAATVTNGVAGLSGLQGFSVGLARRLSDGTYSMGALANFLKTEAGGNILSTPNLVTLDNEEAKIVVGENVPFVTGSFTNTGSGSSSGSVNPFQTIERKDVGLTLRVRPQVGDGGTVRMTIFQEDARVNAATATATNGPTTSKSSIETSVVVDDGQVLVLGGLMKDEFGDGESKVPLLGDLPVLGHLFKTQQRSRIKSNLMVFLRPVVMRSQDDANALTLDRYEYMRQRQMSSKPQESTLLPINEVPVLDPLKLSTRMTLPSTQQPLDDPSTPVTNVLMPPGTGYVPKLVAEPPAAR